MRSASCSAASLLLIASSTVLGEHDLAEEDRLQHDASLGEQPLQALLDLACHHLTAGGVEVLGLVVDRRPADHRPELREDDHARVILAERPVEAGAGGRVDMV